MVICRRSGKKTAVLLAEDCASDDDFHDFRTACVDPADPGITIHPTDLELLHIPGPAVQLDTQINHLAFDFRRRVFRYVFSLFLMSTTVGFTGVSPGP